MGVIVALAVAVTFMVAAVPASAADRARSSYWTYDVEMGIEGLDVTGEATYTSEGDDTIAVGGAEYDVTVMRVTGGLSASTSVLGMDMVMEVTLDGYSYELSGTLATVKDDLTMIANTTVDALGMEITTDTEFQSVTTYEPALLVGFDDESGTGDSWTEDISTTSTSETWIDGASSGETTDETEMIYSIEIAASLDDVDVDGTIYSCLKITITDQDGNREMRWYNEEVGYYCQVMQFESGVSSPVATFKLTDFSNESSLSMLLLLAGIGIAVAVVALVAILLLMRRRKPAPMPPMQPVQPGYYAPPTQGPPPPPAPPPGQ